MGYGRVEERTFWNGTFDGGESENLLIPNRNNVIYLAKISLSSCSDTNWPKLATNNVEHGAFAANGGFGCCDVPLELTGLARAGEGKKWPGGRPAEICIDWG